MKYTIYKSKDRGYANHGWLETYHSFSFASYYNPDMMQFGALRVINDDSIAPTKGFGTHPHDNMEIITIPLEGKLKHEDSMGNSSVIKSGEIQVMSAGKGVLHSEYNADDSNICKLLQIWVLPKERNIKPRYDQISLEQVYKKNELYGILSPNPEESGVWINQDAWFSMGDLDDGVTQTYNVRNSNGVYVFVIEGCIEIYGQVLNRRDAIGIEEADEFVIKSIDKSNILIMDIPMSI